MAFADDMRRFQASVATRSRDIFVGVAAAAQDSIVNGSPITASPGQPVDTGALKASWELVFPAPNIAEISTKLTYAPAIEEGIGAHGPLTLRSEVGGFHSVKLTIAGFPRIVEDVTRRTVAAT